MNLLLYSKAHMDNEAQKSNLLRYLDIIIVKCIYKTSADVIDNKRAQADQAKIDK